MFARGTFSVLTVSQLRTDDAVYAAISLIEGFCKRLPVFANSATMFRLPFQEPKG
jgi:hypothetical protein